MGGGQAAGSAEAELGGIADARAYTPRGRTVRESAEQRRVSRATRSSDPFRPALQVLDGGRSGAGRQTRQREAAIPTERVSGPQRTRDRDAAAAPGTAARVGGGGTTGRTGVTTGRTGGTVRRDRPGQRPGRGGSPPGRRPPRPFRPPRPSELADPSRRLRLGTFLVLALFAVIGIRLIVLQVAEAPAYADAGVWDRLSGPVVIPAPRGSIYDRTGAVLAHSVEARYVYADPEMVEDPQAAAAALSPLLGVPRSELLERLVRQKRPDGQDSRFEWLARGVDIEMARRITGLGLAGIGVRHDERREVPGADLAANLLGFVGVDMIGLEGIEARYDEVLRGVNGERIFETGNGDLRSAEIPGGYNRETKAQPGSSLQLTIDRDLQYEVQRILATMMAERRGSLAAAVVLDVRTGEVLAQASHPTYNAADPASSAPADRQDVATSFTAEPGSVHKPLVFGAALEEGLIEPDSVLPIGPVIVKGDTTFRDTHPVPQGTGTSLAGLMAYSSNVGTIKIADLLGSDRLHDYQQRFGLGARTGIGLPGEDPGKLLPVSRWSESSRGSVPLGHSLDATPLQMAAAYVAIANDGLWVQPRLIRETIAPDGTRTPAPEPTTRRVLSPENAAALRTIMEAVTTVPGATGTAAALAGYRIAGKTGTGRRIVNGEVAPGEVASFIGMAPADDPRYVIAVVAHTPGGGGGDVSAPAFRDMMAFTLTHYRVPPSGAEPPVFVVHP